MSIQAQRHLICAIRSESPDLAEAIQRIGPLDIETQRSHSLGYFLSRSVVGQQLSTHSARSIWSRIIHASRYCGEPIPDLFHSRSRPVLRRCGVSGNKIKGLESIRSAHVEGALSAEVVDGMKTDCRSEYLQQIWGIGPWTCDMTAIFFYGDVDVWPEGDVSVQTTLYNFVGRKAHAVAKRCTPHRSTLALYMWRMRDGG